MNTRYIVSAIIQDNDKILLGRKSPGRGPYPDVWHTPGGGIENQIEVKKLFEKADYDNQFFHSELKREVKEELGIEIKNLQCIIPKYRSVPLEDETPNKHGEITHYYFLEYLCEYAGGNLRPADDLVEAKWVKKDELKRVDLTPPSKIIYRDLGWI